MSSAFKWAVFILIMTVISIATISVELDDQESNSAIRVSRNFYVHTDCNARTICYDRLGKISCLADETAVNYYCGKK